MYRKIISTSILRALSSLLFCMIASCCCVAQDNKNASELPDSLKPAAIDLTAWFDLVGLAEKLFSDYGQYEAGIRYNYQDKFFPTFEIGLGKANHDDDVTGVHYDTSAPYFKFGCDYNISKQKHADHKILIGLRYAFTSYKVNINSQSIDPIWQTPYDFRVENEKANMHWIEAVFSLGTRIWGPLRLEWSVRYKHRLKSKEGIQDKVWYVPGYGTYTNSRIMAMFNVGLQLSSDLWKKKHTAKAD